jgi:putative ABC transport system permease protein
VMARKLWPNSDPLNTRIRAGNATQNDWATIVGVVSSVRHDSLTIEPGPELYIPFDQRTVVATSVVVRTSGDPAQLAAAVRNAVWSEGKQVPISHMHTIDDVLALSTQRQRVTMTLLLAIAGLGLVLGIGGVAGLVSYAVRQRRREVAIRLALGARARDITSLLASNGFLWATGGIVVGSGLTWGLTRYMRGLLFEVSPLDPVTLAAVPALLLLVAVTAAYLPALRAARTSPAEALQD